MAINPTLNASINRPRWRRLSDKLPPPNWPARYKTDFAYATGENEKHRISRLNSSNGDEPAPCFSVLA